MHRFFPFLLLYSASLLNGASASLEEIMSRMDAASPKFTGMTADMSRTTYTKVLDEKTVESGTIRMRKQAKDLQVLINLTKPDAKVVAFRGRKAEMYLPKLNTVQEYDLGKQRSLVDQFLMAGFGTSGRELQTSYSPKLIGEEMVAGQKTYHLELTPLNSSVKEKLQKLDLWLNESAEYPIQQRFLQPSGDYYLVTFSGVKMTPVPSEDDLRLKLPSNVKREKQK